jgi:hypothetical protein
MRTLSLYLDSSVIGGYFDAEFMVDTRALWRLHNEGLYHFVSSQLVLQEVSAAPERVRRLMHDTYSFEQILDRSPEAETLARAYLAQRVVPLDYEDDARHVAICTVARIDYLVSWNFRHLVNVRREAGFNAVNVLQGYPPVRIVAPTFLIHGYQDEEL